MSRLNFTLLSLAALGFIALLPMTGCSSTPKGDGSKTAQSLTSVADSVRQGEEQARATLDALNQMIARPGDIAAQYGQFTKALASLDSHAKRVRDAAASMQKSGAAYLDQWNEQLAQISNEDIRKRSEKRQADVAKSLENLQSDYQKLADSFKPFMSDLRDIESVLKTDLTGAGLDSIKKIASKVTKQADKIYSLADKVASDFDQAGLAMSSLTGGAN